MGLGPRRADPVLVFLSDTINPHPRPPLPPRPIGPQPDIAVLVLVEGIGAQVGRHQLLKPITLVAGISSRSGEVVQDSVNCGHAVISGGQGRPVGRACDRGILARITGRICPFFSCPYRAHTLSRRPEAAPHIKETSPVIDKGRALAKNACLFTRIGGLEVYLLSGDSPDIVLLLPLTGAAAETVSPSLRSGKPFSASAPQSEVKSTLKWKIRDQSY